MGPSLICKMEGDGTNSLNLDTATQVHIGRDVPIYKNVPTAHLGNFCCQSGQGLPQTDPSHSAVYNQESQPLSWAQPHFSSNLVGRGRTPKTVAVGVCRPIRATVPSQCPKNEETLPSCQRSLCLSQRPVAQTGPLIVTLPPVRTSTSPTGGPAQESQYDIPRSATTANQGDPGDVSGYSTASQHDDEDVRKILQTYRHLDRCLFFFKDLTMTDAKRKLAKYKPGTFLLRTSSDPSFILSLSVKTPRGTTSIRIAYRNKMFCLDSDPRLHGQLPSFTSVFELLAHYIKLGSTFQKNNVVFLEATGRKDTPIVLKNPCYKEPGSLKHLSRLAIHSALRNKTTTLHGLPGASTSIIDFLMEYPHTL